MRCALRVNDPNVQKVVDLGLRFGVRFLDARREVPEDATPAPLFNPLCPIFATFGKPGEPGAVFLCPDLTWEEWGMAGVEGGGFHTSPEVVVLHEIAHALVGSEARTIPWEQAAMLYLWPGDHDRMDELLRYEDGAVLYCEEREAYDQLVTEGILTPDGMLAP